MTDAPAVHFDPRYGFGRGQIRGVSTDAIAGMLFAGETAEQVCDDYGITRHELLVACWFEGAHGSDEERLHAGWRQWADEVAYPRLAGWQVLDVDTMPLPPSRPD